MSGVILASWAQLLLLACIIVMTASQSCDDVICCSGKVCVESIGRNGKNQTRCVTPASCDQLDCPTGFVCMEDGKGKVGGKAKCQVTCSSVDCTESFECKEKPSSTECVWNPPVSCSSMHCPLGTSCQLLSEGKKQYAVCLGDSCDSVECSDGSECFDGTRTTTSRGKDSISVETEHGSVTISLKTLQIKAGKKPSKPPKGKVSLTEADVAICLPVCGDVDICPEGLVCEDQNHRITCRPPRNCKEMDCAPDQECVEIECGHPKTTHHHHHHHNTHTRNETMTGSRPIDAGPPSGIEAGNGETATRQTDKRSEARPGQILLQCVDIDSSGDTPTFPPATTESIGGDV